MTGEPERGTLCHRRDRQRDMGAPFEAVMVFPAAAARVRGQVKTFDHAGGPGSAMDRHFRPDRGSGLVNTVDHDPDIIAVPVGTLDNPSVFTPTTAFFRDNAPPWMNIVDGIKRFDRRLA